MYKNIVMIFMMLMPVFVHSFMRQNKIGLIISNVNPVFHEMREVKRELARDNFHIVSQDIDCELSELEESPFTEDVKIITKAHVYNTLTSEPVLKIKIEMLRLSDKKIISRDFSVPRTNPIQLSLGIKEMLRELLPIVNIDNPKVLTVDGKEFSFEKIDYMGVRVGDEIKIRYQSSRHGKTESTAIVQKITKDEIVARDMSGRVEVGDEVMLYTAKRSRFSINLGAIVPREKTFVARLDDTYWQSDTFWSVGFKIEGEFERFLPYQLISTTAFGVNVDRGLIVYIMTGIGYRGIVDTWEFVPYFRLGGMYRALIMSPTTENIGNLQGFAIGVGLSAGLNMVKRIDDMFVGLDMGVQYYPFSAITVMTDSEKVQPQWQTDGQFSDYFSEIFPYLSVKVGWVF